MSSLKTSVFLVILEKVVLTLAGISLSIILARALGPAGFGEWRLLLSAQNISLYLLGMGLSVVVTRYTAEFLKDERFDALTGLFIKSLIIMLVVIAIAAMLFLIFVDSLGVRFTSVLVSTDIAYFVVGVLSINLLNDIVGRAFFTGLKRRDLVAIVQITGRGLLLVAVLIAGVKGFITLESAVILLLGAYAVEFGFYGVLLVKHRNIFQRGRGYSLAGEGGRIARFAGFQWLFKLAQVFREYSVDNYMLLMMRNVESVGFYGAAVTVPVLIRGVSPVKLFSGILIPNLVPKREHLNNSSQDRVKFYFRLIQKVNAIVVWPMALTGIAFAHEIIVAVFGVSFINGVLAMQVLIGFMLVQTAADSFYTLAIALEESRLMFMTSLWGGVNLALNFVLIPVWGVTGAAFGTGVISLGIYAHFKIGFSRKGWEFEFPWDACYKVMLALVPLSLVIILDFVTDIPPGYKILSAVFCLLVFLWFIRKFSPFNIDEKKILINKFGRFGQVIIAQENH